MYGIFGMAGRPFNHFIGAPSACRSIEILQNNGTNAPESKVSSHHMHGSCYCGCVDLIVWQDPKNKEISVVKSHMCLNLTYDVSVSYLDITKLGCFRPPEKCDVFILEFCVLP